MRLFLSSQDLGKYAGTAAILAGSNKKAAFIRNAQDEKFPRERNFSAPAKKKMFEDAHFTFEEIDLRDYFGKKEKLEDKLSSFGSIWCAGGNTFILRRAMKASGLDEILIKRLKNDDVLYGGWSAGAIIMTPSLEGAEYGDEPSPDVVPEDYPIKETLWDALNLVPYAIIPHCSSEWFIKDAELSEQYFTSHNLPFKKLEDGQVIMIDGEKEILLK